MVDLERITGGDPKSKKKGGGSLKQPKVKLSKEQKKFVDEQVKLENRIHVCREYIALWLQFFRFFAENLVNREIKPDEEKAFFQTMSQLAKKQFLFTQLMGNTFDRGNQIIDVLATAVSLSYIQVMPESTYSKMELDWHSLLLDMNKALGRLLRKLPGNLPLSEALSRLERGEMFTDGKKKKK